MIMNEGVEKNDLLEPSPRFIEMTIIFSFFLVSLYTLEYLHTRSWIVILVYSNAK